MTEDLFPEEAFKLFDPVNVVPAALFLVSEDAPTNMIVGAGAGGIKAQKRDESGFSGVGVLAARAVYIKVIGHEYFHHKGEVRFARTLD